jgi:hypothetical protein
MKMATTASMKGWRVQMLELTLRYPRNALSPSERCAGHVEETIEIGLKKDRRSRREPWTDLRRKLFVVRE